MEKQNFYILVTYAGALPFIACAIMLYVGINELNLLGSIDQITATYALIIVSFLAGIHLGTYLLYKTQVPNYLFILSNIFALIAWLTVLTSSNLAALFVLIGAFIYLLLVDYLLRREKFISASYFNTRVVVTAISTFSLLFAASTG